MPGPGQSGGAARSPRGMDTGAFGIGTSTSLHTEIAAYCTRASDSRLWSQSTESTGSVTVSGGESVVATGTTAGARALLSSVQAVSYVPGSGIRMMWTARFPDGGATGATLIAGPQHEEAACAVGYDSSGVFGLLLLRGAAVEIRKVVIDTAATGAETITVTLNGTANNAAVTSGTAAQNAREIAENGAPFTDGSGSWVAQAIGDTVYFLRDRRGTAGGSYSISSTGTLDASAGVEQVQAGAAGTENWVPQSSWSEAAQVIDPTVGNIYAIEFGFLGYLSPMLFAATPGVQGWTHCYTYPWQGTAAATETNVQDPRFKIAYLAESDTSEVNLRIAGGSVFGALEGNGGDQLGPNFAVTSGFVGSISSTEIPILSIQPTRVDLRLGRQSRRRLITQEVAISNVGSKELVFRAYIGTPSSIPGYSFVSSDVDEVMLYDVSATSITGSLDLRHVRSLAAGESGVISDRASEHPLQPGEVMIITAACVGASTSTAVVSIGGHEDP